MQQPPEVDVVFNVDDFLDRTIVAGGRVKVGHTVFLFIGAWVLLKIWRIISWYIKNYQV